MKKENGSLTVEACLSLTIFMMVFITILFIMRIVFAYGIVQHALNQTAKEFSSYSYYFSVSGLGDINNAINSSTAPGIDKFNANVGNVVNVYNQFSDLSGDVADIGSDFKSGNITSATTKLGNVAGSYDEIKGSVEGAVDTFKYIAGDPIDALKSVGSVLLSGANEKGKTLAFGEISRALMTKYIDDSYDKADVRLKNLRVVGGLKGLDFTLSKFWSPGSEDDIIITVCYTIDPVFPIDVIDEINLVNTVRVRGWSGDSLF